MASRATQIPNKNSKDFIAGSCIWNLFRYKCDYGIAAGGLGLATLKAVLSYCGKPYSVIHDGMRVTIFGLGRPRHHDFPPPVNRRYVVDCDIPDHVLFPARYTTLNQMDFGSCIDVPGLARMLSLMSVCVRKELVKDRNGLSSLIHPAMKAMKFLGSRHSEFFMRLEGKGPHGEVKRMLLEILAHDGSGLEIPVTPVILLVKKMLRGDLLPAGAYPCMGLFSLAEFKQELSAYPMVLGDERDAMTGVLLRDILRASFDAMPESVRRMHDIESTRDVRGISRVIGGTNSVSCLIRIVAALPKPAHRASIHIRFGKGQNLEEWDRHFGNSRFRTVMKREGHYLAEHLVAFPVTFVHEVSADRDGFSLHVVKVRF